MDLLAFGNHRVTGKRIGVLAADQHTNPTDVRVNDPQTGPVTICPDQLLEKRWYNLAVMIEN